MHRRERFYIESIKCVNKYIPTRTKKEKIDYQKEWLKDNPDYMKDYMKDYYNFNAILEKLYYNFIIKIINFINN